MPPATHHSSLNEVRPSAFATLLEQPWKKEYERLFCNRHIVTVEYAQTELVHDELDSQLRLDGVAGFVQRGSESGNTHHTGQYGHYATAYTALGGYAGSVHPVA